MCIVHARSTCACGADDAVVDVGAAVDCDLQTVVGVVVLRWLIVGIELRGEEQPGSESGTAYWQNTKLLSTHYIHAVRSLLEASVPPTLRDE